MMCRSPTSTPRNGQANLAVAGQDVDLIDGTVLENLRLAAPEAVEAAVISAAKRARLDEFVRSLAQGYDTWVGQGGTRFSGGQRQRIGLARALLRDPGFLLLDEATSSLDEDLESDIRAMIGATTKGRTVLVITHRVNTIVDVDHLVVLDDGPRALRRRAGFLLRSGALVRLRMLE